MLSIAAVALVVVVIAAVAIPPRVNSTGGDVKDEDSSSDSEDITGCKRLVRLKANPNKIY